MGIASDRYEGRFGQHTIELIRNDWEKTLCLCIDGACVAQEHRFLPKEITLRADFEDGGAMHTVVARQHVKAILGLPIHANESVEVDGAPLAMRKTK
jgi:hypothetical protein